MVKLADDAQYDPASTFMSTTSPYRIMDESKVWTFNTQTNRYEWK
jgi:hypothetical protein